MWYIAVEAKVDVVTPLGCTCVDIIGMYTLKGNNNTSCKFIGVTMVDPVNNILEIEEIPSVDSTNKKGISGL